MLKTRELVRAIRCCKTAAEERAVISKECALIRTAFKEEDTNYRQRNVSKLLFIHLLGYPTHFGQLECVKLIACPRFHEKRVGYLGLSQLLDENSDILMLVTNSIGQDLQSENQYIVALALTAVGNIANHEICITLTRDVCQLMNSPNPLIRKKSILCAVRIVRKVDDFHGKFDSLIGKLLDDKSHGVLLATCTLMNSLLVQDCEKYRKAFRKHIPSLMNLLQCVMHYGYTSSAEYDISGVPDPFLQCRILSTMRMIAQGSKKQSEALADTLAQVATNTDGKKNAGNAVLYEAARTITKIEVDESLRTLAVNLLARFLQNKDNNIRYVALSVLHSVVKIDLKAVQRHRATIIVSLDDSDASIRRSGLDVAFALVNSDNIKSMSMELLNLLLSTNDGEFKSNLVSKICIAVELYAPNRRWQIDTLIRAMSLAGDHVNDDVRDSFIQVVSVSAGLHQYTVHKLYCAVHGNLGQEALVQVAIWCIGEYGDLLTDSTAKGPDGGNIVVAPSAILDLLEDIMKQVSSPVAKSTFRSSMMMGEAGGSGATTHGSVAGAIDKSQHKTQEYLLTCLLKLSTRFPGELARVKKLLSQFDTNVSLELQQRACESVQLLGAEWNDSRNSILDRMPILSEKSQRLALRPSGDDSINEVLPIGSTKSSQKASTLLDIDNLLDLDDDVPPQQSTQKSSAALSELLGVLDSNSDVVNQQQPTVFAATGSSVAAVVQSPGAATALSLATEQKLTATVLDNAGSQNVVHKNGLRVVFDFPQGYSEEGTNIMFVVKSWNECIEPFRDYVLEIAVPKHTKLQMLTASSSTVLPSSGPVTQQVYLTAQKRPVAMKLRISYFQEERKIQEMVHVSAVCPSA